MNERGRRFSHLSWHNRLKIDKMLKEGYKAQEIADALHVHNSTIYRETKRGLTVSGQLNWLTARYTAPTRRSGNTKRARAYTGRT